MVVKTQSLSYETQSYKTLHETLKFQEKSLKWQTNNVQAMLLQSEKVSEIHFPAIWIPKLQKFLVLTMRAPHGDS